MKKSQKLLCAVSLLSSILMVTGCDDNKTSAPVIIPQPENISISAGAVTITSAFSITVSAALELSSQAAFLSERLKTAAGLELKILTGKSEKAINLMLDPGLKEALGIEGYKLDAAGSEVTITGTSHAGVFNGIQTLFQLLPTEIYSDKPVEGIRWSLPSVSITDKPRFEWRGYMLDVSRHFFPAAHIYRVIDQMAMHKLNVLQLHLTDDQGWRIEIKKYPKLTDVGAWRVNREDKHWNSREAQKPGEKADYGGFYTQEDIRSFVKYAAERNITIVPEIEMPAHSTAALAAYPEFSCTGEPLYVLPGGIWPCNNIFCAGKEETFTFLQDVLSEIIELFPSKYIHIGGDEADKSQWEKCPLCQKRMKAEGLKDEKELQSYLIERVEVFLNSKGRDLIGWDEILEGGLAPNAAVMSWRGTEGGIEAAKSGHKVVMTPTSHCYFDYYQGAPEMEPLAIGGYLPLEKVYSFEPVPEELTPEEAKMVIGAQANLWTEYVATQEHADYMTYPRLAAISEVCWTRPELKNFGDFSVRLKTQLSRYGKAGINYSKSFSSVSISTAYNKEKNEITCELTTGFPGSEVRYTTDGSEPVTSSPLYQGPFKLKETCTIKAVAVVSGEVFSKVSEKKVLLHLATGRPISYTFGYSKKYAGEGDATVVNGIRGTTNFSDGSWLGFDGTDMICTIDLGSEVTIQRIATGALQAPGSWIFFPTGIDYWYSLDGKGYDGLGTVANSEGTDSPERQLQDFSLTFNPVKARYIQVIAKNLGMCPPGHAGAGNRCWMFLDEIVVE
jgi:hexosaminidase